MSIDSKYLTIEKNNVDGKEITESEFQSTTKDWLINNLEDIFDRDIIYKKVKVDNTYPKYLVDNINYYKDWII